MITIRLLTMRLSLKQISSLLGFLAFCYKIRIAQINLFTQYMCNLRVFTFRAGHSFLLKSPIKLYLSVVRGILVTYCNLIIHRE